MASPLVDDIVVSTDDPNVMAAVRGMPVRALDRPPHLATDTASTDDVLRQVDGVLGGPSGGPELMVLLQVTSPLRERDLIARGIEMLQARPEADRLIEVTNQRLFTGRVADGWWQAGFPEDTRSQDLPALWYPSGRLYVFRCRVMFDRETPAGRDKCLALTAERERCTNIDHEEDFLWAEGVYSRFHAEFSHLNPEERSSEDQ